MHGLQPVLCRTPLLWPPKFQFAAEMDALSGCVLQKTPVPTPGEMGLQDMRIVLAGERIGSAWRGVGQNLMLRLIRRSHAPSGDGVDWLFEKNEQSANSHSCGCIRLTVGVDSV